MVDDELFAAWEALYQAAANDLTVRAQQLPEIVQYQFNAAMPSLALAQRFYADAARADELVSRNAAPHPLFMPLAIQALAT